MAPQSAPIPPQITPPPAIPSFVSPSSFSFDAQSFSNLLADISSMYGLSSYSYDPNVYSSLLAQYSYDPNEYSSILAQYSLSLPSYALPGTTTAPSTATAAGGRTTKTSNTSSGGGGGMSTGAKVGIAVGVLLAVGLIIGIGIFLWCAGKRKGRKHATTIVAQPASAQMQTSTAYVPPNGSSSIFQSQQGYIPGQVSHQQPVHTGYAPGPSPLLQQPQFGQQQYDQQQQYGQHGQHGQYQYGQPQNGASYDSGFKEPAAGAVELEHEYHFARPGVVEMGDGTPEEAPKETRRKWFGGSSS
ncbi:hypothetical protein BU24DRAFT_404759 [Aaosphaeria arxii CBS 175.79]|uniref:Mid2 domain-containing protein n=1 Tax=Aaosphaeria arxii CBS 175.79 TaxID=1450172 RepID=A0A6A5YAQ1_9PLEO|nr:uncharacterized protein BU24DRAFT_404759 [Aaosphaeria arxii CBS 175.79]KAF2021801.1 hypothetical protein BU24DRAFT_404759 [Aaosphaeria arxii CBS 175.79]